MTKRPDLPRRRPSRQIGRSARNTALHLRIVSFLSRLHTNGKDCPLSRDKKLRTPDSARHFSVAIAQARSRKMQKQLIAQLLEIVAQDQVPDRPGRREPCAVKRR